MPWIMAGAIVGSALIGGAGAYAGGQAQAGAANNAAQLSNQQFQQTRQDLAPWRQAGVGALGQINDLMGLGGGYSGGNAFAQPQQSPGMMAAQGIRPDNGGGITAGAVLTGGMGSQLFGENNSSALQDIARAISQGLPVYDSDWAKAGFGPGGAALGGGAPGATTGPPPIDAATAQQNAFAKFRTDPGYQFAFDEGSKALQNSAAARGILNSGATAKALTRYGQGVADQQYGNYFNRLQSLAGIGQSATNQTANYGAQSANAQGNAFMNAGNARASAYSGIAGSANQGIQNYLTYQGQNQPYSNANGGYYNGGYLAPFNSPAAAMGY